nr:RecName: Full=Chymotrypsin inhibitor; AltName: Full=MCI [Mythimna unipuncta]
FDESFGFQGPSTYEKTPLGEPA